MFFRIENMLRKLYYLYQNSSKHYCKLKKFSKAYKKMVLKPSKAHGKAYIDHNYHAME